MLGSLASVAQLERKVCSHLRRERCRKITRYGSVQRIRTEGGAQETKSESIPPHWAAVKFWMSTAFIETCFLFLQPPLGVYLQFVGDHSHLRVRASIPTALNSKLFYWQCPEITTASYSAVVLHVLMGQNSFFSCLFSHADPFPPDL